MMSRIFEWARNDINKWHVIWAGEMLVFLWSINFALYVIIYMSEFYVTLNWFQNAICILDKNACSIVYFVEYFLLQLPAT